MDRGKPAFLRDLSGRFAAVRKWRGWSSKPVRIITILLLLLLITLVPGKLVLAVALPALLYLVFRETKTIWEGVTYAFLLLFVCLVIYNFKTEYCRDATVIKVASLPAEFIAVNKGYTSGNFEKQVCSRVYAMRNAMEKVHVEAKRQAIGFVGFENSLPDVNIKVQDIGFSLGSFLQYVSMSEYFQRLFRYEITLASCDVVWSESRGTWVCLLRLDGRKREYDGSLPWEGEKTFLDLASVILKYVSPAESIGYYIGTGDHEGAIRRGEELLRLKFDEARIHLYMGFVRMKQNRLDDAMNEYRLALFHKPDYYEALYYQGVALSAMGKPREAIDAYTEFLRHTPDSPEGHFNLGQLYYSYGKTGAALAEYAAALKYGRNVAVIHHNIGKVYLKMQRDDDAKREFLQAIRRDPDLADAHVMLAGIYDDQKNFKEAQAERRLVAYLDERNEKEYTAALADSPSDPELHFKLAEICERKGLLDAAESEYKKAIALSPGYDEAHIRLGALYGQKGEDGKLVAEYRSVIDRRPDAVSVRAALAYFYYQKKNYDGAISELKEYMRYRNDEMYAHFLLGLCYFDKGMYDDAGREFETTLRFDPRHADSHKFLGLAYLNKGDIDRGLKHLKTIAEMNPSAYKPVLAEGYGVAAQAALDKGDTRRAESYLKSAIKADPSLARAHVLLASIYAKQGKREAGLREVKAAMNSPDGLYYMGEYFMASGDIPNALSCYRQSLRSDKTSPEKKKDAENRIRMLTGQQ